MANFLFYLMATGVVLSALGVVLARNPVKSVVALLSSLIFLSVIYLLAGFQFLAAVQILLYGGAVMVLFLFVVMLLNLGDPEVTESVDEPLFHSGRRAWIGIAVALAICLVGLVTLLRGAMAGLPAGLEQAAFEMPAEGFDPVIPLAGEMFTRYSLPFEAASLLLLASAVGVLVVAKRQRPAQLGPPGEKGDETGGSTA